HPVTGGGSTQEPHPKRTVPNGRRLGYFLSASSDGSVIVGSHLDFVRAILVITGVRPGKIEANTIVHVNATAQA
ncbi:MAG: hypothetical protein ACRDID_06450, partial [Ktedonobacterales bacterium]